VSTPKIQAFTVKEACKLLGISRASLDRLVKRKQLRRTKLLGRCLYRATELEKLLDRATR
jgi:excisionase family DNA binding protein